MSLDVSTQLGVLRSATRASIRAENGRKMVVSNMAFIFHDIWDVILPID